MAWHTIEMRREENEQGPQFYARKTQSGVEIVCWKGGYPIKDSLIVDIYLWAMVYLGEAEGNLVPRRE